MKLYLFYTLIFLSSISCQTSSYLQNHENIDWEIYAKPPNQPITNTDFFWGVAASRWERLLLNEDELEEKCRHITKLDFVLSNLNAYSTEDILYYNQFIHVHTIRISNTRIKIGIYEALKTYPNLKTIIVDDINFVNNELEESNNSVDFSSYKGNNFKIINSKDYVFYED